MNTLKIKVLLILSKQYLFRALRKATLVWLCANLIGCAILYGLDTFFFQSPRDFITGILLSLVFSSPAVVIGTWVLYTLPYVSTVLKRTLLSLSSIAITSAFILWVVALLVQLEYIAVVRILYPFVLAAIVCFFLIARKQITSPIHLSITASSK